MNIKDIDAEIARLASKSYSALWASQMSSDLNGLGDPDDVRAAADFYGNADNIARLGQLKFMRYVKIHFRDMEGELLPLMDRLRQFANDTPDARRAERDLIGDEGPAV